MAFTTSYGFNGLGTPTRINVTTTNSQYYPGAVLTNSGNAAVFYYDKSISGGRLLGRLIGTDGAASNNCLDMFREMFLVTGLQKLRHGADDADDGAGHAEQGGGWVHC